MSISPQNKGYNLYFQKEDKNVNPMQYARAANNFNNYVSDYPAIKSIKDTYMPGPMHFGVAVKEKKDHRFFDIDLNTAYGTWLREYANGNLGYKVGGNKKYYHGYSYFNMPKEEGIEVYKLKFAVVTTGREQSRIFRRWFLKTTSVKNVWLTNERIYGYINIPNIENLVNRFLEEVQAYEDYTVEIESVIKTTGYNNVYINGKEITNSIRLKNIKKDANHKDMINMSTGWLSIADKTLYYTMVNHIRSVLFKLIDKIEAYNGEKEDDDKIEIVAANTDGITVYAYKTFEYILESLIEYELNQFSPFKFEIDNIYTYEEAHFTKNDIRRKDIGKTFNN